MFNDVPTGQIFLHQYLFIFRLARMAITGIAQSSRIMGIIAPVILVNDLRWNIPLVVIPIGHTVQNTGNWKIAEPTREAIKTPFATEG